jgi:uncharacterized protein
MERFSLSSLYETRDTHEKMRTDLNHLPEEKQRELGQIARVIGNTEAFNLAEPRELTAQERHAISRADFDNWYEQATGFYDGYEFNYSKQNLRFAIFNLNQATESAYKAILLVYTSYCPHEHMLEWIGRDAEKFGPVLYDIFSNDTKEHEEYFKLMNRAYIGARYQKDFIVHWHDLDYLAPRVNQLLEVTERICLAHLESMVK